VRARLSFTAGATDIRAVEAIENSALVGLADRRFQSFSEAAEAVLAALEEVIPGTVMLGRFDLEDQVCRVVEVRGDGVNGMRRGTTIPLAAPAAAGPEREGHRNGSVDGLDGEHLLSLGVRTWLASPLETSDGDIVGSLCAFETSSDPYGSDHAALLGVAARLLSYEWETVQRRAELRRLRESAADGPGTDPETSLPRREAFLEILEREWKLVERGTVQSVIVVCRVVIRPSGQAGAEAMAILALKDAAEALRVTARSTDHVGHAAGTTLAAILIGCQNDGARAFVQRFQAAVARVTQARPLAVEVACGFQPLAGTASALEALELADGAAGLQQAADRLSEPRRAGTRADS
jgi:GGDEF domain-containing protein